MNKGIQLEQLAGKYGFILNPKSNAKASTDADAIDFKGRTHQLKSDRATVANNYRREIGNDIIKEFKQLMDDDSSEMITLIANYDGIIFYTFSKAGIKEMITDYPETIHYDRASSKNGGGTTIRIKVKKKHDSIYRRYAEERVEV